MRWAELCRRCGLVWPLGSGRWRCGCGGLFDLIGPRVDPLADTLASWSMWRYRSSLPDSGGSLPWEKTTLGEGMTPLIEVEPGVLAKMEQMSPTGSFKDRGAAVMLALAAGAGEKVVVADSSGNAGKAVAAYAARAGLESEIFVPVGTAATKLAAARASGARVIEVDGDREEAARAARQRVEAGGAWYASHVYQAAFVHGVKTAAFEIFEQLGATAPAAVVMPAGNGSLVQGMWLGFRELSVACGADMPILIAAQSERYAALEGKAPTGEPTAAAGIAIARPPRAPQVRAAVVASRGRVVPVGEDAIAGACDELARWGVSVEPTGAVAWAARRVAMPAPGPVVVILTGR
jgi:threonine synthase